MHSFGQQLPGRGGIAGPQPDAPSTGDIDWGLHHQWQWRGVTCHWRVLGDPLHPPLLLLHGFAAGSGHWRRNAAPLAAAGWRVYGLDLVGFGASCQPRLWLDNRLWARQVQAFLEQVVRSPAVLVGNSLGGLVALSAAVFHPTWVRAVAAAPLADPSLLMAVPLRSPRRKPWRRRLKRWLVISLCRLLPLELLVPLLAHSPLLDLGIQSAYLTAVMGDRDLHRLIAKPARRPGAVRALRSMSIAMALRPHGALAPTLLRRLERPLLLIWGRADQLVPIEVASQVEALRPQLPLVVLEHCGHCPHDEVPQAFNQALLQWLEQLPHCQGELPA
ncbi:alpha/beta fold hydrolase [Cyanobium sp. WAJ14-Wanaka]|uniref:alpha/beta fold hydrolase n=1 Tax=Cyanobium sp. WAJ14-Wanaka TaxID=2823725 RepID=UPI0037BFAB9F